MRIRDLIMSAKQQIEFHTSGFPLHLIVMGYTCLLTQWIYNQLFDYFTGYRWKR